MIFRKKQSIREEIPFDPETQYAVIRASICTGERVACFRDRNGSGVREVMLIRSRADEERFKTTYGLDSVKTEY